MKILATSDLHGHLPDIPDCDVLLIAGDSCLGFDKGRELDWWLGEFAPWLMLLEERNIKVIGIGGNHDFILQEAPEINKHLPWTYLCDSGCEIEGIKFWGSPWQPWFGGWAFNAPQRDPNEKFLREKFQQIPVDTDVLITHSPPHGFHDWVGREHVGSKALYDAVIHRVKPRLSVYGHIHVGFGQQMIGDSILANVSACGRVGGNDYEYINPPVAFEIE